MELNEIIDYLESIGYMGNSGLDYATAIILIVVLLGIIYIIKYTVLVFLKKQAEKTVNRFDDAAIVFIDDIKFCFLGYISLYAGMKILILPAIVDRIIDIILWIIVIYYAIKGIGDITDYFVQSNIEKRKEKEEQANTSLVRVLGRVIKLVVWIIAFLMLLSNFGINITSLVAGMGIAGIAIAFALQEVLGDIFASVSIYFDKPFQEGDFVILGTDMGVIKHIGIKSTRITALQGQEIVVSNRELTTTRINNYKRMQKRRIQFGFGIEYGTKTDKMKKINDIVKEVVDARKDTKLDRCHFKNFGDSSLNYEVVYYIDSSDYNKYMDAQQEINFGIKDRLEKIGVSMAFPTSTIHIVK